MVPDVPEAGPASPSPVPSPTLPSSSGIVGAVNRGALFVTAVDVAADARLFVEHGSLLLLGECGRAIPGVASVTNSLFSLSLRRGREGYRIADSGIAGAMSSSTLSPTDSLWLASAPPTAYPALVDDLEVDVAVIGGGIAGTSAALALKRDGARVALLERGVICGGATGLTTAKVSALQACKYSEIRELHGDDGAAAYARASLAAVARIDELVREEQIDCAWERVPAYTYAAVEATGSTRSSGRPTPRAPPASTCACRRAWRCPSTSSRRVAPRRPGPARSGPLRARPRGGGGGRRVARLREHRGVRGRRGRALLRAHAGRRERHRHRRDRRHELPAARPRAVLRPHGGGAQLSRRRAPARAPDRRACSSPPASRRRSLRSYSDGDEHWLLVGGEGHLTGSEEAQPARFAALENFAREHFDVADIPYRWSTQDGMPADKLPYIGPYTPASEHLFVAAGFQKWGMTNATIAATLLADRHRRPGERLRGASSTPTARRSARRRRSSRRSCGSPATSSATG